MRLGRMAAALTLAAAALTGAETAGAATVIAQSRFDTGAEGWRNGDFTVGNTTYEVGWNPAGFITAADDKQPELFSAFLAPSSYLGDRRDARGGTLSFDLASLYRDDDGAALPYVTLRGGGVLLYGLLRTTPPGEAFSRFEVVLTAENFLRGNPEDHQGVTPVSAEEFDQVLRDLSQLSIRADIHSGEDLASLDNVVLTAGAGVPEPASWAIMILGLGLTGAALRSERRWMARRR